MNAENQQIVTLFEEVGMGPDEIAQSEEMDLIAVKTILMQCSSLYRQESKQNKSLEFTVDEAEEMKQILLNRARYSEDEHLQVKCAIFIINDKKGRLDGGRMLGQLGNAVINFNMQMQKVQDARERTLKKAEEVKQLVDVK